MTKQPLDMEKLFKHSFDDFAPKTSNRFNTKMAKRLGIASLFGFAISSSIAKIGTAIKAIAFETVGLMKTGGIVKSIAVVTVISTIIATSIIFNNAEKVNKKKNQQITLIEKRNVQYTQLPLFSIKTASIHLLDFEIESKLVNKNILASNTALKELKPMPLLFDDNTNLVETTTKESLIITKIQDAKNSQSIAENTKESKNGDTGNTSQVISKENDTPAKPSQVINTQGKQNSNLFLADISTKENAQEPILHLKSIPYLPLKISDDTLNTLNKNHLQVTTDIFEEPNNKSFFSDINIFGDVHFMPFSYHNLSTIKPLTNDTIINQFIQETPQLSYQLGFDIRLQKKQKPWFINLGVNYQKISEQVDYYFEEKTIGYWDYDSTVYYLINPPHLDTIYQVDSSFTTQWAGKENDIMHTNSYHYLNVPIQFGYEFFRKKEFSLQVSTGIEMAASINSSGYLYDYKGQIINYAHIETSLSIDWYYLASFGLNYQMNKTTLFILPSIKYQLNTNKINNYPKEHKYFVYGLKLGVRFKLFQ